MAPTPEQQHQDSFEKNRANRELSSDELQRISDISNTLKQPENSEANEQVVKSINQIDNEFLNNIKAQSELILRDLQYEKGKDPDQQKISAMLSLLKIHQLQYPGSIQGEIPLTGSIDDVIAIALTIPKDFKGIMTDQTKVKDYLDKKIAEKRQSASDAYDEGARNGEIFKSGVEGQTEVVSDYKAKLYIDKLISDIENNSNLNDAKTRFAFIREKFFNQDGTIKDEGKTFSFAINALFKKCIKERQDQFGMLGDGELDLDNKLFSKKIQAFQKAANTDEFREVLKYGGLKSGIDGKLGYNTLKIIQAVVDKIDTDFSVKVDVTAKQIETHRTVDGKEAEQYPDNVKRILDMGEFGADGKFKFYNGENGKEDYVQQDDKGNFVNIGGERYYIDGECNCGDEFNKFKQVVKPYIGYDENGNEITLYKRILSFGKVHENGRFEGTKVTIDGNNKQVKSETFDVPKVREIGNKKVPSNIVDVKLGNNIDDNGDFKGKWRIDLFTDKDKKTLNEKELNSLDKKDLLTFLNMAINDYKETDHKPSGIGQANLNLVIDLAIRELRKEDNRAVLGELIKNADPRTGYFANGITPEERVSRFFNLDPGLYSNPDNIINKNNLEGEELKKYNSLKTNAEKRKYRSTLKQGDRIINRLKLLQKALEGKTDTNPSTTKTETEVNKQEEIIDSAIGNLASSGDDVRDKIGGGKLKGNIPGERQDQNEGVVSTEDDDTPSQEKEKTINNQDIGTFGKLEANIQYNLNKYKIGSINQGAFIYLGKFSGFDNNMIHILNEYNGRVGLDGGKINPEMISQLTNGPKQISISGNIDNSDEALLNSLKNIGKIDRGIFLPHLNNVNGNMCEYLTTWGRISLEGLKTIDSDSLRVLGTSKINHLALGHVDITNQEDVRNLLKNYDGRLSLNSIPEIDVDAAKGLENQKNTVKINSVGKLDLTDENILKSLGKMKTKLVINNVENIIVDENKKQEYMEKYNITISGKKIIVNNNLNHF